MVAIEMRHKPFVLWIKDLSAPDPAHILNLFGLLPFTPPSFLAIGVLAVLLGITMWLQFKLNPAAMDPIQQQMFVIMPWVLMFVMAPFAAGPADLLDHLQPADHGAAEVSLLRAPAAEGAGGARTRRDRRARQRRARRRERRKRVSAQRGRPPSEL